MYSGFKIIFGRVRQRQFPMTLGISDTVSDVDNFFPQSAIHYYPSRLRQG